MTPSVPHLTHPVTFADALPMHEYRISPDAPFSFEQTAALLSPGEGEVIDVFDGKRYTRLLELDGRMRLALVSNLGAEQRPELIITLMNGTEQDERPITRALNRMLGMEFDLGPFYQLCRADPQLYGLSRDHYGLKPPQRLHPFEALALSIVGSPVGTHYFRASLSAIAEECAYNVAYAGHTFCAFPSAATLAEQRVRDLVRGGIRSQQAEYLHDLAVAVVEGELDLEVLARQPLDNLLASLRQCRGIGDLGAQLTALVGYGRLDCFPSADPALRQWIARQVHGADQVDERTAETWAEQWGEVRGVVACYIYAELLKSGDI